LCFGDFHYYKSVQYVRETQGSEDIKIYAPGPPGARTGTSGSAFISRKQRCSTGHTPSRAGPPVILASVLPANAFGRFKIAAFVILGSMFGKIHRAYDVRFRPQTAGTVNILDCGRGPWSNTTHGKPTRCLFRLIRRRTSIRRDLGQFFKSSKPPVLGRVIVSRGAGGQTSGAEEGKKIQGASLPSRSPNHLHGIG